METYFGPEFFKGNRLKLRTLFAGTAPIVLTANGLLQRNGDVNFPFRQDSSFWYLTGINEASIVLVMDKDKEYLILPERGRAQEALDSNIDVGEIAKRSAITTILDHKSGWKILDTRLKKVKHIATLSAAPAFVEVYGMYTNPARAALISSLKNRAPQAKLLDLRSHLTRMRVIKQPKELEAMQISIDVTCNTLKEVKKKLSKYEYEYEIEADISAGFRKKGATGHAWPPVVASGANAVKPHYVINNEKLSSSDLLVVDVGAEINNYTADISRTYALGAPSKRQKAVHKAVEDVQNYALNFIKPGTMLRTYELEVEQFMGEKLRALGLIRSINKTNVREFYPHATSHFLGLDAHDAGDYDLPLEPNMVLTVEPGIYIPKEGIGIRIEDDILITPTGHQVLSNKLPRALV